MKFTVLKRIKCESEGQYLVAEYDGEVRNMVWKAEEVDLSTMEELVTEYECRAIHEPTWVEITAPYDE